MTPVPPFRVTHATLSVQALLEEILPAYDLGAPLTCRLINLGLNDTFEVTTLEGRFILRAYRAGWRTADDIAYELDVLRHLHQQGVAVSFPLPRRDGTLTQAIHAPDGPRTLVMFSYAPGEEPAYDAEAARQAYQYGRGVARLHAGSDGFHSQHTRFPLDLEHLLAGPLRAIEPVLAARPADWAYLLQLAERLRAWLADLPLAALEWGFCHGDCHGWNAHLDGEDQLTFFDFDCCGAGWRAYDLATFRWLARHDQKEQERWPHFLRGYQEIRSLPPLDLAAVPLFVAVRQVWLMGLHAANAPDWGYGWLNRAYFDKHLKYLKAWEDEQGAEHPV